MIVGEQTNKVIAYQAYSRSCSRCEKSGYKPHDGECYRNFNGTAKSMEPQGMLACLNNIKAAGFNTKSVIIDNDGSTTDVIVVILSKLIILF